MGIGEIKTRVLGFFGQGDDPRLLVAASIPLPFSYKPSPTSIDVEKMRQCAESHREIEKLSTQVTRFAALRLAGGATAVVSAFLGGNYLREGDFLKGLGYLGVGFSAEQLFIRARRSYQEGARHEENLIQLYNLTCVEAPSPSPVPVKAPNT